MARIRNIKPGFFKDADLFDAEKATGLPLRLAYAGLWTVADRAGRFKWKPREIGTDVLPYDNVDMVAVLEALVRYGFIFKYKSAGFEYGYVPNFEKHQFINRNEAQSQLPDPKENSNAQSLPNSEPSPDEQPPVIHHEYTASSDTDTDVLTQTERAPAKADASKPKADRGTRWPAEQAVPAEWFPPVIERFRELGRAPPDLRLEAVKFANHWVSKTGKDATKIDWEKTFLNWCLNARTEQRSFAEQRFDNLRSGASRSAFVDGERGQGMDGQASNLVRLALPAGAKRET